MRTTIARLSVVLAGALLISTSARADIILPGIDARVSQGAYTVLSSSGVVPAIALTYRELTPDFGASFRLNGNGVGAPFSLQGAIDGEDWDLMFTVVGRLNVTDFFGRSLLEALDFTFQVQHMVALHPSQPSVGPLITIRGTLTSSPYPGFQPTQHLGGIPSFPHGPGRADVVGYNGYAQNIDYRIGLWEFNAAEISDMPEPSTVVLFAMGIPVLWRARRRFTDRAA